MRHALWRWFCRSRVEGERLSGFLLVVRACLFPLQFFYWRMSRAQGYQPDDDTWLIEGVRYSAELLHQFAQADGQVVRIVARKGEVVTVEVIDPERLSIDGQGQMVAGVPGAWRNNEPQA